MIKFTVKGNPIPKQSFRYKKGASYQPKRVTDWQAIVGWAGVEAMQGLDTLEGYVCMTIHFRRKNHRRVDMDNLTKAVCDALNGIVYKDDSQINWRQTSLDYDKINPRVDIKIWRNE